MVLMVATKTFVGSARELKQGNMQKLKDKECNNIGVTGVMKIKNKEINKSVQLSRATHQKLRMFCASSDQTISSVVDKAIILYINNNTN
tara:strand:+ start:869 stop:1135 length:267 start_codon:yes stop_codon:yes gene_type:complete